jgi:SAM-dependent methyltransferase
VVSLFSGNAANEVEAALAAAGVAGRVAVLGDARLARRLADAGRDVVCIGTTTRTLKRARTPAVAGSPGALPLGVGAMAALVAGGLAELDSWEQFLAEWCRVVAPGGLVVVVDRRAPAELGRRALCAGLTAIEQRSAGRTVITAGRWHPL